MPRGSSPKRERQYEHIKDSAKQRGENPIEFSAKMAKAHDDDITAVGCQKPDVEPKVSESIGDIVAFDLVLAD